MYISIVYTHVNFVGGVSDLEVPVDDVLVDVTDGDHVRHAAAPGPRPGPAVAVHHPAAWNKTNIVDRIDISVYIYVE